MKIRFESMVAQHLGAKLLLPLAAAIRGPATAEIADLSRSREARQFAQRPRQDLTTALPLTRRAESPADGVVDENRSRRSDSAHDVVSRSDDERGNAPTFDDVGDETDGLMAERSIGNKKGEVYA
jgi:hypothetical protein